MNKKQWIILGVLCAVVVCAAVVACMFLGKGGNSGAVEARPYIACVSVDGKLAVVYGDKLIQTEYGGGKPQVSLNGEAAVCPTHKGLIYIHDGIVEKISDYTLSYCLSVSGNTVAFWISQEDAPQGNMAPGLYLYLGETGQLEQAVSAAEATVASYTLSPDGQTLAYIVRDKQESTLWLRKNGIASLCYTASSIQERTLISVDNSADIIYIRTGKQGIISVNQAGVETRVCRGTAGGFDHMGNATGIYCNADHTQLMYCADHSVYLSKNGEPGEELMKNPAEPVEPMLSTFQRTKNVTTCNVEELGNQLMKNGDIDTVLFWYPDANGQYEKVAEYGGDEEDYWLDPTARYFYYVNKDREAYVLDLQSDGESVLLAENVEKFAIRYDAGLFSYSMKRLYDQDNLQKYGGYLYTCNGQDGSNSKELKTEVLWEMHFSENGQLFYLVSEDGQKDLYTLNQWGKAKPVLENVQSFVRQDCGMLYVTTEDGYYIIREGQLIQLQRETLD